MSEKLSQPDACEERNNCASCFIETMDAVFRPVNPNSLMVCFMEHHRDSVSASYEVNQRDRLPPIAPNLHMLLFHHHICSSSRTFVVKGGISSNTCEEVLAVHSQGYCESWSVNIKSVDIMGWGIMLNGCNSNKYWDERVFVLLCFKLPPCFKSNELL